jgi:hypothetical protein
VNCRRWCHVPSDDASRLFRRQAQCCLGGFLGDTSSDCWAQVFVSASPRIMPSLTLTTWAVSTGINATTRSSGLGLAWCVMISTVSRKLRPLTFTQTTSSWLFKGPNRQSYLNFITPYFIYTACASVPRDVRDARYAETLPPVKRGAPSRLLYSPETHLRVRQLRRSRTGLSLL